MSDQPARPSESPREPRESPAADGIADLAPDAVRADAAEQVKGGIDPINGFRRPGGTAPVEPING